jgi:hypothetical protein
MGLIVEACFLIGRDGSLLWADRSASAVALPDSRARWEAIWRHRDRLAEIAHSHPSGGLRFSAEDETTMAALDDALGRPLRYSVVTASGMLTREPSATGEPRGPDDAGKPGDPGKPGELRGPDRRQEPWWVDLLRAASGIPPAVESRPTGRSGPAAYQSPSPGSE